jgi:hypothetical protein
VSSYSRFSLTQVKSAGYVFKLPDYSGSFIFSALSNFLIQNKNRVKVGIKAFVSRKDAEGFSQRNKSGQVGRTGPPERFSRTGITFRNGIRKLQSVLKGRTTFSSNTETCSIALCDSPFGGVGD